MFPEWFSKYNMDTWTAEYRTHSYGSALCEETTRSLFGGTTQRSRPLPTATKRRRKKKDVEEKRSEKGKKTQAKF